MLDLRGGSFTNELAAVSLTHISHRRSPKIRTEKDEATVMVLITDQ